MDVSKFSWCRREETSARIFVMYVRHVNQSVGAGTYCVSYIEFSPAGYSPTCISGRVRMCVKQALGVK